MERISGVIVYGNAPIQSNPIIIKEAPAQIVELKDDVYWQDRYIDLLERYSKLLIEQRDPNS